MLGKLNHLIKTTDFFSLEKLGALIPIAEAIVFIPIMVFNLIYSVLFVVSELQLSGVSFLLLKLGTLHENLILIIFSFIPFILKILCAIGMLNKRKKSSLFLGILYFFDFVSALFNLFTLSSIGVLLQEFTIIQDIGVFIYSTIPIFISAYSFLIYFYFTDIEQIKIFTRNPFIKINFKFWLYLLISLIIFLLVFIYNIFDRNIVTDTEIKTMNNCYYYLEEYLYNPLPQDENTLETIQKDIDNVLDTDVFKRTLSKSKFEERFLETKKNDENGYYNATTEKSNYANELIFLKCKVLLALDKNDEFINYYQENQHFFGCWTTPFFNYMDKNTKSFSDDDIVVIDKCMRIVLESETTNSNKFFAIANLTMLYKNIDNYEEEIKYQLVELKVKYLNNYNSDIWVDSDHKLSRVKDCLYILKEN